MEQIGWQTGGWLSNRPRWLRRQFGIQIFGTVIGSANPPFTVPVGERRDALLNLPQTIEAISARAGKEPFFAREWPFFGLRGTKILAVVYLANGIKQSRRIERDLELRLLEGERARLTQAAT